MTFFKRHLPAFILGFIALILCAKNYTPHTFLSGWDTLHPEFNFPLNILRVVTGVFRPEQGLGSVAAHSHMADLPRILLLYVFNFFVPTDFLRYLYIFSMIIIGPIGMYYFLYKVVLRDKVSAFLGGLFYLLNLGTMQQFIVPFEMFTTQYGFLPWLFLTAITFLQEKESRTKSVLFFSLVTLLAIPMAYAATLWYIYFFVFCLFLCVFSLFKGNTLKKSLILVLITLLINAFWLLPNIYFVVTLGTSVGASNINSLFSQQAFLYNKEFGNLKDILLLKSFLFDWGVYSGNGGFDNLLSPWIVHLASPFVEAIGFLTAGIALFGLFLGVKRKHILSFSLLIPFGLCIFFLINDNPPTGFLYTFIQDRIPLFREAFRFPHDKVLILFMFLMSIYFGYGQMLLTKALNKKIKIVYVLLFIGALTYFMLPAFNGELISKYVRISIPSSYFEMFDWFNKQNKNGRVANLPIHSFWGWEYYKWYEQQPSFQGAGFLWFGIKQPVLARDFDRWNPYNEEYYQEISYAIYTQDSSLFASVLKKYNITYILLDKSVIAPEANSKVLFHKETENLLTQLKQEGMLKKSAQFGDNLFVYTYLGNNALNAFSTKQFTTVSPKASTVPQDIAFQKYHTYINTDPPQAAYYPFRGIIDNHNHLINDIVTIGQNGIEITPKSFNYKNFKLPAYAMFESTLPFDLLIEKNSNKLQVTFYPRFPVSSSLSPITTQVPIPKGEKNVLLSINQTNNFVLNDFPESTPLFVGTVMLRTQEANTLALYPNIEDEVLIPDFTNPFFTASNCEQSNNQHIFGIEPLGKNNVSLFAKDTSVCMIIPLSNLFDQAKPKISNAEELLLSVKYEYQGNSSSYVCVANLSNGSCLTYLSRNIPLRPIGTNRSFEFYGITKDAVENVGIKIFMTPQEQGKEAKATYKNMSFALTVPTYRLDIPDSSIRQSLNVATTIDSPKITVPFSNEFNFDITNIPKTTGDCVTSQRINSPNKQLEIIKKELTQFIEYSSEVGSVCDHFSYQNLPHNQGYLIMVTAKNITGLPLYMCVSNYLSKRCDIYAQMTKSKDFVQDMFLLPPMGKGTGFDININNLGIKKTPSINQLKSIQIIPFPYAWASQIEGEEKNTVTSQLFILPQSYNSGWKAYEVDSFLSKTFPFLFGKELKNHVLVNNWENGWILPSTFDLQSSTLVTLYLPQYLEYIGFILLGATILWLGTKILSQKGKQPLNEDFPQQP